MVEQVDTADLKSAAEKRPDSNSGSGTTRINGMRQDNVWLTDLRVKYASVTQLDRVPRYE